MKFRVAVLTVTLMVGTVAHAAYQGASGVLKLEMRDRRCTIQAAGEGEAKVAAAYLFPILQKQMKNLDAWDAFMKSRKWKPRVPMGEQMTPKEAARFEQLRQETKVHLLEWFVEDMRKRDLRVFIVGAGVAEQMDIYHRVPKDEASEAFIIAAALKGGREILALNPKDEAALLARTGKCTLENALIAEADRVKAKAEKAANPDQAASYSNYYLDLLLLARLEGVSKLQRDVRRQSLLEAPGDAEHFSTVWEKWKQQNRITEDQNKLSGILNYIGRKIPSDLVKNQPKIPSASLP